MFMLYAEQLCVGWGHKGLLTGLAGGEKVTVSKKGWFRWLN